MPTSSRRNSRLFQLVLVAALIVSVRLPFLLRADRFFDSDEAVEGLMARHVPRGELPVFLWGQHYKGVPEVYLASAVFGVVEPGVIALKAVTLACFAVFACLQFVLVRILFSTRIAWLTTAFLALGPPSLVLWSLSANAEIVMTLLAGAVMGLALAVWKRTRSLMALAIAGAAVGFGLWVHQYILYYVVALAIVAVQTTQDRRTRVVEFVAGEGLPTWLRVCGRVLLAAAIAYVALGVAAFLTGGFDVTVGGVSIGLRSPQKLWRLGAVMLASSIALTFAGRLAHADGRGARSRAVAVLAGFLVGYAPALAATFQPGRTPPVPRMTASDLRVVGAAIVTDVVPIVAGFRSPTTEWLPVSPWFGVLFAVVAAISFAAVRAHGNNPFFHTLLVVVPVLFIASGSFVDAQSYRYLMPVHGALAVVLAVGVDQISRWSKVAAAAVLAAMLAVCAVQQVNWYRRLAPDARARASLDCLRESGARGAFAGYWLSYKLTFLTDEQLIVAPTESDRYPPYTEFVGSLGLLPTQQPCRYFLLQ